MARTRRRKRDTDSLERIIVYSLLIIGTLAIFWIAIQSAYSASVSITNHFTQSSIMAKAENDGWTDSLLERLNNVETKTNQMVNSNWPVIRFVVSQNTHIVWRIIFVVVVLLFACFTACFWLRQYLDWRTSKQWGKKQNRYYW